MGVFRCCQSRRTATYHMHIYLLLNDAITFFLVYVFAHVRLRFLNFSPYNSWVIYSIISSNKQTKIWTIFSNAHSTIHPLTFNLFKHIFCVALSVVAFFVFVFFAHRFRYHFQHLAWQHWICLSDFVYVWVCVKHIKMCVFKTFVGWALSCCRLLLVILYSEWQPHTFT